MFSKKSVILCLCLAFLASEAQGKTRHAAGIAKLHNVQKSIKHVTAHKRDVDEVAPATTEPVAKDGSDESGSLDGSKESGSLDGTKTDANPVTGFDIVNVAENTDGQTVVTINLSVSYQLEEGENGEKKLNDVVNQVGENTDLFNSSNSAGSKEEGSLDSTGADNTHQVISVVTTSNGDGEGSTVTAVIQVQYIVEDNSGSTGSNESGSLSGSAQQQVDGSNGSHKEEGSLDNVSEDKESDDKESSNDETTVSLSSIASSIGTNASTLAVGGIACLALVLALVAVVVASKKQNSPAPKSVLEVDVEAQEATAEKKETEEEDDSNVEVVEC